MPEISKITLPSGSTYDIKDAQARSDISTIKGAMTGTMTYIGTTTTAISDGSDTQTVAIGDTQVVAKNGNVVIYGDDEFVWSSTDNKWHEFGSTGSLKALAFKDSASGTFKPTGTVSAPSVTVTPTTGTVNSITNVGTLPTATMPTFSATVASETLSLGWTAGAFNSGTLPTKGENMSVVTGIQSATATAPKFTGDEGTVTVR